MQFLSKGRLVNASIDDYRIDWDKKVSGPQKLTKDFLFPFWKNHVCLEEFRIPKTKLRIDLMNITRRIAVEVSPEATHRKFNAHFHRGNRMNYVAVLQRDQDKKKWIEENGFLFVELCDDDLDNLTVELFEEKFKVNL